jgi:aryl-alcohol dehydrogenase-like predicted oxidoreductase
LKPGSGRLTERNKTIAEAVQRVARDAGKSPAQVALNWLLQQPGVVSPIVGVRTQAQLEDNIAALDFVLEPEFMELLNEVSAVSLGFPHDFLRQEHVRTFMSGGARIEPRRGN